MRTAVTYINKYKKKTFVVKIYTRSGVQSNIISYIYYIVCNISPNCLKNNMEHCASMILSVITKNTNNNIIYTMHNNRYIDYVYMILIIIIYYRDLLQ
jgi:hypothetical protein